jgi:hypothetical protein
MKPAASHASITLYPDVGEFDASVGMGCLKVIHHLGILCLMMSSLQSFLALIPSQFPDLRISDNTQLLLSAAACLGVIGLITRAHHSEPASNLPLPSFISSWRLGGHVLPRDK